MPAIRLLNLEAILKLKKKWSFLKKLSAPSANGVAFSTKKAKAIVS